MTPAGSLWDRYVTAAAHDVEQLVTLGDPDEIRGGDPARLGGLAHVAFRLGLSSSLIGAADVAQLAFATERALDHVAAGRLAPDARRTVASAIRTLHDAVA